MDRTTPTKPAARKQKLPPNSAFLPRVLATKSWNESEDEDAVEEKVEEEQDEAVTVEEEAWLSGADPAKLLQQFLVASTKANQQFSSTAKDQTDLERNRPKLEGEISRSKWIEHLTKFNTYKDSECKLTLLQSIEQDLHDYIAEYILDDTLAVLKALTDDEITVLLNSFYRVDAGSGYSTILPKLSMAKTTKFNRDDIDTYAAKFLRTLRKNPTFKDPSHGGADAEFSL